MNSPAKQIEYPSLLSCLGSILDNPYLYLGFNPANGSSKIFRYEDFANGTPQFDLMCEVNPNPTILFVPKNYRG